MKSKGKIIQWESEKLPETKGEPDMKDKLLQCDTSTDKGKAELSRLLGEVLQPETKYYLWADSKKKHPKFDPIPLTPEEAFKRRGLSVEEYGKTVYKDVMVDIYCGKVHISDDIMGSHKDCMAHLDKFILWLATEADETDSLIASALCKLNAEGGSK